MELHLKIVGVLLLILGLLHSYFPVYFKWKDELKNVSLINRQLMYIHTLFIAVVVMFVGVLCITSTHDLLHTSFGKKILLGLSVFWILRLIVQFFGYSKLTWRGKRFETVVHIVLSVFWIYLSGVFLLAYLQSP